MSQTPNYNNFITRIVQMLSTSALLFPNSIGKDNTQQDLVSQIIPYELPNPLYPREGGSPHVFVTTSRTPLLYRQQVGRDSRDAQGPERQTLEFYLVVVVNGPDLQTSEAQMYNIITAITTILGKNKRLTDISTQNPLASTSQYIVVPYLLESEQKTVIAKNVVFRPVVYVNLR